MSVWTHIEGVVSIHKKEHVSVRQVIHDTLTDETVINELKTQEFPDHYTHYMDFNICLDGYEFISAHKRFLEALKPMKGSLDLNCSLRFYS